MGENRLACEGKMISSHFLARSFGIECTVVAFTAAGNTSTESSVLASSARHRSWGLVGYIHRTGSTLLLFFINILETVFPDMALPLAIELVLRLSLDRSLLKLLMLYVHFSIVTSCRRV